MAGTVNNLLRANLTFWWLSPRLPTRGSPLDLTRGLPSFRLPGLGLYHKYHRVRTQGTTEPPRCATATGHAPRHFTITSSPSSHAIHSSIAPYIHAPFPSSRPSSYCLLKTSIYTNCGRPAHGINLLARQYENLVYTAHICLCWDHRIMQRTAHDSPLK